VPLLPTWWPANKHNRLDPCVELRSLRQAEVVFVKKKQLTALADWRSDIAKHISRQTASVIL